MVAPISGEVHAKAARPAGLFDYVKALMQPMSITVLLYVCGLPGAVWSQVRHPSLFNLVNPFAWQRLVLANGFTSVLRVSNEIYVNVKRPVIAAAYGKVLEVGAGSGESAAYYNIDKIERLYCLEPFEPLRTQLAVNLDRAGLTHKTTIIPGGIDKSSRPLLLTAGIEPASLDTIVLVQVLCSIAEPTSHLSFLQSLLKPGGQILLFEHIGSKHKPARTLQNLITPLWRSQYGGCELNRDSADWLRNLGGWSEVEVQRPVSEVSRHVKRRRSCFVGVVLTNPSNSRPLRSFPTLSVALLRPSDAARACLTRSRIATVS